MSGADLWIVSGGSKQDMILQLLDIGRVANPPRFEFSIVNRSRRETVKALRIETRIQGIQSVDGRGNDWIITGSIFPLPSDAPSWAQLLFGSSGKFRARYQTHKREGKLELS